MSVSWDLDGTLLERFLGHIAIIKATWTSSTTSDSERRPRLRPQFLELDQCNLFHGILDALWRICSSTTNSPSSCHLQGRADTDHADDRCSAQQIRNQRHQLEQQTHATVTSYEAGGAPLIRRTNLAK